MGLLVAPVQVLGDFENDEEGARKAQAADGRHLLRQDVDDGDGEQRQGDQSESDRDLAIAPSEIERHLPFARLGEFIAQHQHRQRLHRKTPHHAERVGLPEQIDVAAAEQDRHDLQADDEVDEAVGGAEFAMRMAEPIREDAVLGDAVQHAVRAEDGGVDRPGEHDGADHDDERVEQQSCRHGARQVHRQAADEIVEELRPVAVRDQHHGEKGNQRREQHRVDEDHEAGALEVLELRVGDLAVHLRHRLFAAHGEHGVAETHQQHDAGERSQPTSFEPSERFRAVMDVRGRRERHRLIALQQDRHYAPRDQDHHHHRGQLHDAQRFLARLVHADHVLAPEIHGGEDGEARGEIRRVDRGAGVPEVNDRIIDDSGEIQPGADSADGAGQYVVEQQGRHGEFRQRRAHRLVHDAIDSAAHEHAAALDVHGADRVGEQHDRQHEPRRRLADGRLGDAADVEGGGAQIAKNDGRRPPETDEGQHDGGGDDDFRRTRSTQ